MSVEQEPSFEGEEDTALDGEEGRARGEPLGDQSCGEPLVEQDTTTAEDGDFADEAADGVFASEALYGAEEVNEEVLEELRLHPEMVRQVQAVWEAYLRSAETPEAAGEALYAAVFGIAPNLQALFKTPRAFMATKLLRGVTSIVNGLSDPKSLKAMAEAMGFMHLDYEVTTPRVGLFRDGIVDTVVLETGALCTDAAVRGLRTALNYFGGAFIYVRRHYSDRLRILSTSWAAASARSPDDVAADTAAAAAEEEERSVASARPSSPESSVGGGGRRRKRRRSRGDCGSARSTRSGDRKRSLGAPATFAEMFRFNATVMGFGESVWMEEVLRSFDDLVRNVANSYRLQEVCDILVLRLSKHRRSVDLADFKAVMLASLRSLVPTSWDSRHEDAWSWLWQNVERLIVAQLGKPARQQRALAKMFADLTGQDLTSFRQQVYGRFFELAPSGMAFFKQSTTRLHFVADKVAAMTLDFYREPDATVDDLSAIGLRHVGYGVPSELCGPFVCAYVGVLRQVVKDQEAADAFEWSLSLISRILARVISEGSTMVMRAINANSGRQISKAVECAPRCERAAWVLNISVGSQSISPLMWAVETGSLEAAQAILKDLLTIRADRDRYYYGADALFDRHPDIVRRLCVDAPRLLPTLLDGLIWRSRLTEGGRRRVVYFAKHLVVRADGGFAQAIEWITHHQDPNLVCHDIVSYVIDLIWTHVAARAFVYRKSLLLLTTFAYVLSQSILNGGLHLEQSQHIAVRVVILLCRCVIYLFSWPSLVATQLKLARSDLRGMSTQALLRFDLPARWLELDSVVSTALCMILPVMLASEPMLHCAWQQDDQELLLTERCARGDVWLDVYSFFSMCGMFCYFVLLADLSVFSNRISAFALVFKQMVTELALFVVGFAFVLLAFACGTSAFKPEDDNFNTAPAALKAYLQMFLGMAGSDLYEELAGSPVLFCIIVVFVFVSTVYMLNLLVAQLACAYRTMFHDMIGWARLRRGAICVGSMASVSPARWRRFVSSLDLDRPCQFGEGDVGMPGSVQMMEPANLHGTTGDAIRRFGGSTSPAAAWPEEEGGRAAAADATEDRLEKIERILRRMSKQVEASRRGSASGSVSGAASSLYLSSARNSDGSKGSEIGGAE